MNNVCPNCGYCPACGRRDARPYNPWRTYPWQTPLPGGPYWIDGNTTIKQDPNIHIGDSPNMVSYTLKSRIGNSVTTRY